MSKETAIELAERVIEATAHDIGREVIPCAPEISDDARALAAYVIAQSVWDAEAVGRGLWKILDVSTRHAPSTAPDFGDLRWGPAADGYGWVLWLPEFGPAENFREHPKWLRPILRKAQRETCVMLNFDRDGHLHADLPTFDW